MLGIQEKAAEHFPGGVAQVVLEKLPGPGRAVEDRPLLQLFLRVAAGKLQRGLQKREFRDSDSRFRNHRVPIR